MISSASPGVLCGQAQVVRSQFPDPSLSTSAVPPAYSLPPPVGPENFCVIFGFCTTYRSRQTSIREVGPPAAAAAIGIITAAACCPPGRRHRRQPREASRKERKSRKKRQRMRAMFACPLFALFAFLSAEELLGSVVPCSFCTCCHNNEMSHSGRTAQNKPNLAGVKCAKRTQFPGSRGLETPDCAKRTQFRAVKCAKRAQFGLIRFERTLELKEWTC